MVGVGPSGSQSALARVTIVDWHGATVYDAFVRPRETVTDYRTFVSGIQPADLDDATAAVDFVACRRDVQALLRGKILIGHALKNDLRALDLTHPWQHTRDTAKYEPFMKVRHGAADGKLWPRKLQELCHERLRLDIQEPGRPHSPYEDAVAALRLYQLVRSKWEKVMAYKVKKTAEIELLQQGDTTQEEPMPKHADRILN